MGPSFSAINEKMKKLIEDSAVFFVATAPMGNQGHINLSPKGLDSFRVLSPTQVAYLDLTGSGAETIAHIRENGRITVMFVAFSGPPNILRLYGKGRILLPETQEFKELISTFEPLPGVRSIIVVDLDRISNSCGFGVPRMKLEGSRSELTDWSTKKGEAGMIKYQAQKNARSIDDLPALENFS